ncbi:MAG: hypothetical protein JSW40_00095 [Candidatus Omnitrophota bacterium]|nr:MAG: hypothetical protein JSW40_00095 [Candidatus Omnitrophota bacterium]
MGRRRYRIVTILWISLGIFVAPLGLCFAQEDEGGTISLTTYYPAPYGVYDRLFTGALGVGDNAAIEGLDASDAPDPEIVAQQGDVWITGNVGIGIEEPQNNPPQNKLDVAGGVVIGSGYAGANAPPGNGLLVEGNVGIKTINPGANLEVDETLQLTPFTPPPLDPQAEPQGVRGGLYYNGPNNVIKYHDNEGWKEISMGGQLGPSTNIKSPWVEGSPVGSLHLATEVWCPPGYVATQIRLYTDNTCPSSCSISGPEIHNIGLTCREVQ